VFPKWLVSARAGGNALVRHLVWMDDSAEARAPMFAGAPHFDEFYANFVGMLRRRFGGGA